MASVSGSRGLDPREQGVTGIHPAPTLSRCWVSLFNPKGKGVRCIHPKGHFGPHVFGKVR